MVPAASVGEPRARRLPCTRNGQSPRQSQRRCHGGVIDDEVEDLAHRTASYLLIYGIMKPVRLHWEDGTLKDVKSGPLKHSLCRPMAPGISLRRAVPQSSQVI